MVFVEVGDCVEIVWVDEFEVVFEVFSYFGIDVIVNGCYCSFLFGIGLGKMD